MSLLSGELPGIVGLLRKANGELTVTVDGCSMEPVFRGPAAVRVRCGPALDYPVGTIILFAGERGRLIVHRVAGIGRRGEYLIARGDHNFAIDLPVKPQSVLGVVIGIGDNMRVLNTEVPGGNLQRMMVRAARCHLRIAYVLAAASRLIQYLMRRLGR